MIALVTQWGHALAAFLFGALVLWQSMIRQGGLRRITLTLACAMTALWCASVAIGGPLSLASGLTKNFADFGWLTFLFALQPPDREDRRRSAMLASYGTVTLVLLTGCIVKILPILFQGSPRIQEGIFLANMVLRMAAPIGALLIVYNLFTAASPEARWRISLPMLALALMWMFDLNIATVAYLADRWPIELFAIRGFVLALLSSLLVTVSRFPNVDRVQPSRSATFQLLPLIGIAGYLALMVLLSKMLRLVGTFEMLGNATIALGFSCVALILFPSSRMRTWLRTTLARHLFQHRYDYRLEWRRFTHTLGRPGGGAAPLNERMVQAIADIPDSPGGVLLLTADDGGLDIFARWNWPLLDAPQRAGSPALAHYLESSGEVIELDPIRHGEVSAASTLLPDWMIFEERAWVIVPLLHFDRLVGAVLLEQPPVNRLLDWEDHDLLRVTGRQVASYLAEARGQEALSDARRFDEFNRRFAFIMHDIKNLVSQLSLLARNAERHADNPAFRADMIATLQSSVGKMNDLLARLSQHHRSRPSPPERHRLKPIVERVIAARGGRHAVNVHGRDDVVAMVDPARFEQALGHLIQNAAEASKAGDPVDIRVTQQRTEAVVEVIDRGCGMSPEFMRSRLFHPFSSTKDDGFGIGAYEAQSLIAAMGGRLEAESREGEGSCFAIILQMPAPLSRPTMQAAQ
jgi:putative PEP-CTERM system histidine kinase